MKTNLVPCWLLQYSEYASVLTVQINKPVLLTSELSFSIPSRKYCKEGHSNQALILPQSLQISSAISICG